jgi:hypothetical protein
MKYMGIFETVMGVLSLLAYAFGWAFIVLVLLSAILILVSLLLIAYQFRTGNFLFPNLLVAGIDFFESPIRVVLRAFKIDDLRMDKIAIRLKTRPCTSLSGRYLTKRGPYSCPSASDRPPVRQSFLRKALNAGTAEHAEYQRHRKKRRSWGT